MDVDGTLTDGKIYIGCDGENMKAFNVKDGYAIHNICPKYDVIPIIITSRNSEIVKRRAIELGIEELHQGIVNKKESMIHICEKYNKHLGANNRIIDTIYIGDDVPDLECMQIAEVRGCPSDACAIVKENADYISVKEGGVGAVREFVDWLISSGKV